MMRRIALLCSLLLAPPALFAASPGRMTEKIERILNSPQYRQAFWGLEVADLKTGEILYEKNSEKLFAPASTTKLFSGAAALVSLGPDLRFETKLYRRGEVSDWTLTGDLILKASGDPNLSGRRDASGRLLFKDEDHIYAAFLDDAELTPTDPLEGLDDLARQVAAAGIRRLDGDVLIDDRLFEGGEGTGSGPSRLSPVIVNDNVIDILITPAAQAGAAATLTLRPAVLYAQVDSRVETVAPGAGTHVEVESPAPRRYIVRGKIEAGRRPLLRIGVVQDPADFARAMLIESLGRRGVFVSASALAPATRESLPPWDGYSSLPVVAVRTSPPFSETLRVIEKVSHNLHAGILPLLVAVQNGKRTLEEGLQIQGKTLAALGLDVSTISFGSAAGGAPSDQVTPRATVQLLRAMAARPDFPVYRDALPILGVDGTIATAVGADSPARGRVHAKTGTLVWEDPMNERLLLASKALAGYMQTSKGRWLAFAFFLNKTYGKQVTIAVEQGRVLGRICEIIVREN
jgi:D-alanyl-D-alanine carboxypeptidase/D-alanyl-D-alanine-endopeptidase (penicillin-binding protein 4)